MNKFITSLALAIGLSHPLGLRADTSLQNDPGYLAIDQALDFKAVHPQVDVNLPRFLLKDAASSLNGGPDDPFKGTDINFADLIKDVKLIRVVVIEAAKTDREALDHGMKTLRAELDTKWTPLVAVNDESKKHDEKVGIYVRSKDGGDSMAGLALLVYDGKDAVIGNIVGQVSIGKIVKIASHMDKFPKDILKKLTSPKALGAKDSTAAPQDTPAEKTEPLK